jgi:hypothetical protein
MLLYLGKDAVLKGVVQVARVQMEQVLSCVSRTLLSLCCSLSLLQAIPAEVPV